MRLEAGKNLLGIEGEVAWATPSSFTTHNFPCSEDGKNCVAEKDEPSVVTQHYRDPSTDAAILQERLVSNEGTATKRERRNIRA